MTGRGSSFQRTNSATFFAASRYGALRSSAIRRHETNAAWSHLRNTFGGGILAPRRRLGIHALRLTAKHGTQHMSEDRCMHAHTLMPLPRHQNPARSGANMGIDAGCNALNSDSACSSRAAWRVAPLDTMHPSLRAILINTAYDFHWRCLRNVGSTAKLEVHDGGSGVRYHCCAR